MAIAFIAKMMIGLRWAKLTAMPTGTNTKRILIGLLSNISFEVMMNRRSTPSFFGSMGADSAPCTCVSSEDAARGGDVDTPSLSVLLDVVLARLVEVLPLVADLVGRSTSRRAVSLPRESRAEWSRGLVVEACALICERRRSINPGSSDSTIGVEVQELKFQCTYG